MKTMKTKLALVTLLALCMSLLAACTTAEAAKAPYAPAKTQTTTIITMAEAKTAVLNHLGLAEDQVQFIPGECELDDGVYELELWTGTTKYECKVSAVSGKVLKAVEDWDDDDRYDHWDDKYDDWDDCDDDDDDWDDHQWKGHHHSQQSTRTGHHHDWDD